MAERAIVVCPRCKHVSGFDGDAANSIIRCDECHSRIAYGVLQPKMTIAPARDGDERRILIQMDEAKHYLTDDEAVAVCNGIVRRPVLAEDERFQRVTIRGLANPPDDTCPAVVAYSYHEALLEDSVDGYAEYQLDHGWARLLVDNILSIAHTPHPG